MAMHAYDTIPNYRSKNKKTNKMMQSKSPPTYFIQEKLDGCNFRVFLFYERDSQATPEHREITYGSRRMALKCDEDFHGFRRIEKDIEEATRRLADITGFSSFTIHGELVGKKPNGQLILPRIHYNIEGKETIRYFALEISTQEREYIPFKKCQELLNESGFHTIPYKEYVGEFSPDKHEFESIYFNHKDETRIEGYVVRICDSDSGEIVRRCKVKTPNFVDNEKGPGKQKPDEVVSDDNLNRAFLDFISKHNFMEEDVFKVRKDKVKECVDAFVEEFAEDNGDCWKKNPKRIISFVYRKYVK